jgi:hypothetical protein
MFEWREAKRLEVIRDRDLDFRDATQVFERATDHPHGVIQE